MTHSLEEISQATKNITNEWIEQSYVKPGDIFVVGCSTSEVAGERIGTSGSVQIAKSIYDVLVDFQKATGIHLAFQGCEHINRSLVIERETMQHLHLDEVAVIPIASAGGSMAAYAYEQMIDPVVIEFIEADAGIDIGDTMIGMHIKHVAVPLRLRQKTIGQANVTAARRRPKLIGGARAVYSR